MAVNRGSALSWALGLGVLLASVAGTLVSAPSAGAELRNVGLFALLFIPSLYVMIAREWDQWAKKHPFVRYVVLFIGGFCAITVLVTLARVLLGGFGILSTTVEFLAGVAGFGVAAWLALYGGGERIWWYLMDAFDVDW